MSTLDKNRKDKFERVMDKLECIDRKIDRIIGGNGKTGELFDGERIMDNQDLCLMLGVTKRTLQRYRQHRKIAFHTTGGKTYYRASDVEEFMKRVAKKTGNINVNY